MTVSAIAETLIMVKSLYSKTTAKTIIFAIYFIKL